MRNTGFLAIPLALFLFAFGCGSSTSSSLANSPARQSEKLNEDQRGSIDAPTSGQPASAANTAAKPSEKLPNVGKTVADKISLQQSADSTIDTSPTDRKIIRNADLTIESETPEDAQREITSIAERSGGFVVESQATSTDNKMARRDLVNISIRVPAAKFAEALDQIRRTGARVIIETVRGDDVTEEFIDVEARLRAKKALEAQFLEIMKRANSVNEALSVQTQIAEVRGEIERIEGRKRFLENQASLSTIKVKLQTSTTTSIAASSSGFFPRLAQAFMAGLDFAINFVLGLLTVIIALLPFAIFIGLPVYLLIRYLWRRRSRLKTAGEIARDEISIS